MTASSLTSPHLDDSSTGQVTKVFTAQGHISSVRTLCVTECPAEERQSPVQLTTCCPSASQNQETHSSFTEGLKTRDATSDRTSGTLLGGSGRYLLFSGGGRASLKCWRTDISAIDVSDSCHGSKLTSSPLVFLAEYSERLSNYKRRRNRRKDRALSEIRFMSLTSLCLQGFCAQSEIDRCQSLYSVVAACSDGFVR